MIVELEEEDIEGMLAGQLDVLAAGGIVVRPSEQTAAAVGSDPGAVWSGSHLDYLRWCASWVENERERMRKEEKQV